MAVEYKLEGLEELRAKLSTVTDDMAKKGGRTALRKAAQIIRNQARANAASVDNSASTANIAANITERFSGKIFKRTGNLMFRIGVMGGARPGKNPEALSGLPGKDTRHWRHVEMGTSKVGARPFLRPAAEQAGQAAVTAFVTEYGKALTRAIARARRKKK